ncbi:MAG: MmcQ/YjbR family DNA-binding protein [Actinomycetota bacterium]|nr:MmcQ/YjbR family DNA-binding protein [Actinomycetota bacterium]
MATLEFDRVRAIALALPEVTERLSHGATCFFVRVKRPLCYFHDHHNDDRVSLWCPAPPGMQQALVASEPKRFFKPPTSANGTFSDWLGVFLDPSGDAAVDWSEIAEILEDAFRLVAPATAVAELDRR